MCTCARFISTSFLLISHVFLLVMTIISDGRIIEKNYCPLIETLSFGSDIRIQCNNSYFIFNETNSEKLNWKFANQTSFCRQNGSQQASIDQCGLIRLNAQYFKVPLKSSEHNERACAYCRINSKPIAPIIRTTRLEGGRHVAYRFEIQATGLMPNESFEILWAKRVSARLRFSYNYWFLQKCIESIVTILETHPDRIVFVVDDVPIRRVEFIVRRCQNGCRLYNTCEDKQFLKEISENYFHVPDTIEKVSCDQECLNSPSSTLSTDFDDPPSSKIDASPVTSAITTSQPKIFDQRLIVILSSILLGFLLTLLLILFIFFTWQRLREQRHDYGKANHVDPDEHH